MPNRLEHVLYQTSARIFEEMAFALPMPDWPEGGLPPAVATRVAFVGPFTGQVVLMVSAGMLPVLAADMLGEDTPPPPAEQADALGELANVLCGNLLPALAGGHDVFTLDAPTPIPPDADPARPDEWLLAAVELPLAEGHASIRLFGDAAAAVALVEAP